MKKSFVVTIAFVAGLLSVNGFCENPFSVDKSRGEWTLFVIPDTQGYVENWREEGYFYEEMVETFKWLGEVADDMNVQVMPDGASYELTPGYQMAIASWFLDAFTVARKFDRDLDPRLEAGIRRMYDWCVSINRPDFSRPSVSDAGSTDARYGRALSGPGQR